VRSSVRRIGLEQEFFLVDASGKISDLGDVLLGACWESARAEGVDPGCFKAECVHSLVEVTTPPSAGFSPLVENYITNLNLALDAAAGLGLRLYPLGTYPLPTRPTVRDDPRYRLKARTIGYERFLNAGRCAGVHLHIEAPPGTIWPHVKTAHAAPAAAREEMLDLYNLATALDPALVAISRACPFYEGQMSGLAARTIHYRGGFGPEGVYTNIQEVGALGPYAAAVENLEAEERERYVAWYRAMDLAGVERSLFSLTGAGVHRASWNPVRLNRHGTVEIRSMDSNYPQITLAVCAVVCGAFDRVRYEHLRVKPMPGVRTLRGDGGTLLVPDFAYLSETLLRAAVNAGVEDPDVEAYLGSLLQFAAPYVEEPEHVGRLLGADGGYCTTEAEIRRRLPGAMPSIPQAEGLRMVQESCRLLEEQVHTLCRRRRGGLREIAPHYGGETGGGHRRAARSTANGPISAALLGGDEPSADSPGPLAMLPAREVRTRRLEKGGS
jgi:carboxylate-amine ligase